MAAAARRTGLPRDEQGPQEGRHGWKWGLARAFPFGQLAEADGLWTLTYVEAARL